MRPSNSQFLTNGIVGSASFSISSSIYSDCIVRASFQFTCASGSMAGTFQMQGSNDQAVGAPANQFTPTNWSTITSASVTASTTSTSRTFMILPIETSYEYLRVSFTDNSGGTANGLVNGRLKGIGF